MLKRAVLVLLVFLTSMVLNGGITGLTPFNDGINTKKLNNFQENEVSIDSLRGSPEEYLNQTVVASGKPDIALGVDQGNEDTYIIHSYFNRSKKVYFRGCGDVSTTPEKVYVKGEFPNMTDEQRKHMELAKQAYEEYNVSNPLEPSNFLGIKCEKIIKRN